MGKKPIVAASAAAVALAALWTGTAFAGRSAPSAAGGAVETQITAKDTSRRVCRNLVISGTRLTTRYCRTQAEWDQAADKAGRDVQDSQINRSRRDGEMNGLGMVGAPR